MSAHVLHNSLLELRLADVDEPHVDLRRRLVEVLRAGGAAGASFDMMDDDWATVPARAEGELAAEPPHLLLAWCDDLDGVRLFLLPLDASAPHEHLLADARLLRGAVFADGSDLEPARLGAALRLLVAMGPGTSTQHYESWRAEIDHAGGATAVGVRSADDLVSYQAALVPLTLSDPAHLVHRIVEVSSVRKAS